jgi:glutamate-1-semialdehyde 2,1-aminomutase
MSFEWYRRANASIAQGSLTNSKRVETLIKGVTPTHVTHGEGPYLYGVDGKKYIDFCCANGTQIFGYGHPAIRGAIESQLKSGWLYSLGSTREIEAAEIVKNHTPFVKKVRFLKNGSDACEAAVRIACAHTEKSKVLSSGYHGFNSQFVSLTPPAVGIPKQAHIESFTTLDQIKTDVACVIIEPIETDHSAKRLEWLQSVITKCKENGVLVIFDEIITGFRWPKYSFSAWSGIHPDIICLGKAAGGGLPLSILGLAEHIGDKHDWFVSSTAAGELLSLAVLKKTYEMLHNKYKLDELWSDGQHFLDQFNSLWPEKLKIEGYPTRGVFKGDQLVKALFWQESHKAGILFGPSWFFGFQHRDLRDSVISTSRDIIQRIKTGHVVLEGEMPTSPFAEKQRSTT